MLPNDPMGLSFSAHWQHLNGIHKLKQRRNPDAQITVYWVLQTAGIPSKMKFVADKKDREHFFITVTEKLTVWELVAKPKWVADWMSVMQDASRAL